MKPEVLCFHSSFIIIVKGREKALTEDVDLVGVTGEAEKGKIRFYY